MADFTPVDRILSPLLNTKTKYGSPDDYYSTLAHFNSIPWVARHLSAPNAVPFIVQYPIPITANHDQFFSSILASDRAISHILCIFHHAPDDKDQIWDKTRPITEIHTFYTVGKGLTSYPDILHGGALASMVDEAMGMIPELNSFLQKEGEVFGKACVTAGLEIKLLKPIYVGTVLHVVSRIEEINGRKMAISCEVKDEKGSVLTKSRSLWIVIRSKV